MGVPESRDPGNPGSAARGYHCEHGVNLEAGGYCPDCGERDAAPVLDAARRHEFTAKLSIHETALRSDYDSLVADGYEKSWDEYLADQAASFREYANGWWTSAEVVV